MDWQYLKKNNKIQKKVHSEAEHCLFIAVLLFVCFIFENKFSVSFDYIKYQTATH